MKQSNNKTARREGFTLGEVMISAGIFGIVSIAVASLSLNGTILFAKNTAENLAHDQNRIAISRLVRDIHAAISTPQLGRIVPGTLASNVAADPTFPKDGSWTPYGTNVTFRAEANSFKGPSAGVAFKKMGNAINSNGGPFQVKNITGQTDKIMIKSGTTEPVVGMEIVFPYYGEEGLITYVEKETGTGKDHYNIWVEDKLGFRIDQKIKNKNETFVICYYMSRFAYVVENGELRLYSTAPPPEGVTWPVVVARNIINEADRTLPAKPFSQASTDYVGINLTTEDDRYTNRNFKAVNTLLAGSVPIRAQISKVQ